jgi:isopenicillin N synthase-like dioxygenase
MKATRGASWNAALPIVDIDALANDTSPALQDTAADAIGQACREIGFFYVSGHGIDPQLTDRLEATSRAFFALPASDKLAIRMSMAGRAWRGYFPVGGELTSGRPDQKEGIYFGAELSADDPRVLARLPLHGPNLFPDRVPELREVVLAFLSAMTRVSHALLKGIAMSLDLPPDYFYARYTHDPLILFRIFHYPPLPDASNLPLSQKTDTDTVWSVGEHTDYGLIALLLQDDRGGLQVRSGSGWIDAPPVPGTLVCNLGDMLDRMTGGRYRSTPHRVRNTSGRGRLSFPFFFDPGFDTRVAPIDAEGVAVDDRSSRWDRQNVHAFDGSYGDYLLRKVSKVFPELSRDELA